MNEFYAVGQRLRIQTDMGRWSLVVLRDFETLHVEAQYTLLRHYPDEDGSWDWEREFINWLISNGYVEHFDQGVKEWCLGKTNTLKGVWSRTPA